MPDSVTPNPEESRSTPADNEAIDELRAELDDHLATSRAQLQAQGADSKEAEQLAAKRFGDVEQIRRRCWWIQNGDQVMLRTASTLLFVLIGLGLVALGIGGWRMQATFADRMDQLTQQLSNMNATQKTLLDSQQARQQLEIEGVAYVGDESRPAAGAEVQIGRFPDKTIVRRLRVGSDGRFRSGHLPAGDYFVIAPLLDEQLQPARRNRYTLLGQSRPVFLYAGNEHEDVKIDLKHRPSSVNFELSRVLPEKIEVNGRIVECELQTEVSARDIHLLPWSPSSALPAQDWPIVGYDGRRFSGRRGTQLYRRSGGEYSPQAVSKGEAVVDNLTFGRYEVRVTLAAKLTSKASKDDFLPAEEGGEPTDAKGTLEQLMAAAGSGGGGGSIAMMNAGGGMMSSMFSAGPKNEDEVEDLTVNLKPAQQLTLKLAIPKDYESRIRMILAAPKMDANELAAATHPRLLQVTDPGDRNDSPDKK